MHFANAFRREVFASLDVSYIAAATLPPSRRCRVNGALLDELLFVTGLVYSRVVLGAISKGRASLRKFNFLFRKLGSWCHAYDIALESGMGTHLGESGGCPFTEQTDRKLLRITANACASTDVPSRSWICSVSSCRLRPIQRENMCASLNPPVPSVVRK